MTQKDRLLLSGDEAVAQAALDTGIHLGVGYPGTPSTEILEHFSELGGKAQWSPNEKVALEVGIGLAFSGARTLVTMKHVGLNVAADPLFTVAYTGVQGGMVIISADDPGMASSQNEQDNRRYAVAAGVPMLEPSDSQEAYDFTALGIEISEKWQVPVILRMTTRICHSATPVVRRQFAGPEKETQFIRDIPARVMIPAYARPAHRRLRAKLAEIEQWNESSGPNRRIDGDSSLGIIASGVSFMHVREAAPDAGVLKIGMSYPLPLERIRAFAAAYDRCLVVEEGDPYLVESILAAGICVERQPSMFRFGELNVDRVRRIIARDTSPEPAPIPGKPPQLCVGCPHRSVFQFLSEEKCIVSGDIGCYTLGVLPPFQAMDTCVCMGASIGVGLGLRHALPEDQARRVVSVIGDSTFVHSGLTGLAEMIYNPPATGHLVMVLDNGTTAMTGLQEHPGTGRALNHEPAGMLSIEDVARAMGIQVHVLDPVKEYDLLTETVRKALAGNDLTMIVTRKPCILMARRQHTMKTNEG